MLNTKKFETLPVVGWKQEGVSIPTPDGYHAEDYYDEEGNYLGPDDAGIEPVFSE